MSEPVSTLTVTRRRGPRAHLDVLGLGALLLVLLACYAQLAPGLLKLGSITVLSAQFLPLVLAATAQTAIMLVGGVDLSLGTVVALAMATFAVTADPIGVLPAAVASLAAAVAASGVNGALVAFAGLPPIIVTLAASFLWGGVTLIILPRPGGHVPDGLVRAYNNGWHGIALPLVVGIVAGVVWKAAKTTWFGRAMYAVGGNEHGAFANGVNTRAVKIGVYALAGLFTGLAGIALALQAGSADPTVGTPYTLNSITAAVIGGASFFGGVGQLRGTVLGALILGVLTNLMVFSGVSTFYQLILQGLVLIAAITVKSLLTRRGAR